MALVRGIHSDTLAAVSVNGFHPAVLAFVDWPGSPIRVHSGSGTITYLGETWSGIGRFGSLSVPEEGGGVAANTARLTIGGTLTEIMEDFGANIKGRDVDVYLGATTEEQGNVLIGEPFSLFSGYIDSDTFGVSEAGGDIEAEYFIDVAPGPGARSKASISHTDEDQQARYPGDTGFRHTALAAIRATNPQVWPAP